MKKLVAVLAVGVAFVGVRAQSVIFDNTANKTGWFDSPATVELGDGATLAGTDRILTLLEVVIGAGTNVDSDGDATVRIYSGGDNKGVTPPGALLWDSGPIHMTFSLFQTTYAFAVPNVVVPNEITWTVQIANLTDPIDWGPRYTFPPAVGSSVDGVYSRVGGVWDYFDRWGSPMSNYGAKLTAIPEPASMLVLCVGLAALVARRRRKA